MPKAKRATKAEPGAKTVGGPQPARPMPDTGEAIIPGPTKASHLAVLADWVRRTGGDPNQFAGALMRSGGENEMSMTQAEAIDETFATVCPAIADDVELALPGAVKEALGYFNYKIPCGCGGPASSAKARAELKRRNIPANRPED